MLFVNTGWLDRVGDLKYENDTLSWRLPHQLNTSQTIVYDIVVKATDQSHEQPIAEYNYTETYLNLSGRIDEGVTYNASVWPINAVGRGKESSVEVFIDTQHESSVTPRESCDTPPHEACDTPREACDTSCESCDTPREACDTPRDSCDTPCELCWDVIVNINTYVYVSGWLQCKWAWSVCFNCLLNVCLYIYFQNLVDSNNSSATELPISQI